MELVEQLQQVLKESYSEQEIFMHLRSTYLAAQQEQQTMAQTTEQLSNLGQQIQERQPLVQTTNMKSSNYFKPQMCKQKRPITKLLLRLSNINN